MEARAHFLIALRLLVITLCAAALGACGIKGPPRPPLADEPAAQGAEARAPAERCTTCPVPKPSSEESP